MLSIFGIDLRTGKWKDEGDQERRIYVVFNLTWKETCEVPPSIIVPEQPGRAGPGDQLDLRQHRSLNWEEPSYLNTTSKVCHIQIGIHAWNIYFIYQIYLLECGARLKQRKNVYTQDPFNPLPIRQYPAPQWMNVITSMFFTSAISKK